LYNIETKEIVKFDDKRFDKIFKDVEKNYDVDIINCNIVLYCKNKKKEGIENE
jgi:Fe2+ or Zn2+ uptake regulation protein